MPAQFTKGFLSTFGNGLFSVKYVGQNTFELWVGCYDNVKPYRFGLTTNDLEVFANNLLEIVQRCKELENG